ncbi:MAG: polyprenyl synthetase family protein [Phycisphaeraceae bacterium]|nr:MAG: polyprenyl synthetase family protein [Phycisphaeraceae bacterium]
MTSILDVAPEHAPVAAALAESLLHVEEAFELQLRSDLPPVEDLCRHVERYRGKMLRPTMVLLSGMAAGAPREGVIGDDHITIAAVTEMVHLATLVHDDVLDEAETRRRGDTVNRLRGNEVAVILGDYLISKAFHLCSQLDSQDAALRIGEVTNRVCEGELLQLHHRDNHSLDEDTYFEIIRRKTASLIGVACELGASRSGASSDVQYRFRDYGEKLGMAFQIRDDLLDITGDEMVVGKSLGKDLEKGKLTLPMIHHLQTADPMTRGRTLVLLDDFRADSPEHQGAALEAIRSTGSIEYALSEARRLVSEAKASLDAVVDSPARALMLDLAEAVLAREH